MAVDYPSYQGKPFQVISNSNIRYTGIFDSIDQVAQTVCLREVWCWGSEDRPVARPTPPKSENLGWVLFKTNAISSLAVINNYVEPGHAAEAFGDDSLVSVVSEIPVALVTSQPVPFKYLLGLYPYPILTYPPTSYSDETFFGCKCLRATVRERKTHVDNSVAFLLIFNPAPHTRTSIRRAANEQSQDRPDGPSRYPSGPPPTQQPPQQGPPGLSSQFSPPSNNIPLSDRPSQPPRKSSAATAMDRVQQSLSNLSVQRGPEPVPDTEFDFSQTRQFEQQREDHRRPSDRRDSGASDEDQAPGPAPAPEKKSTAYKKSDDFFDGLTDHSTRVARFQEVTRNLDTFGEEGGQVTDGHIPGYNARGRGRGRGGFGQGGRGGYGGERGGRGGYGGRGGHHGGEGRGGYNRSGGYDNERGDYNDRRRGGFGNGGGYNTGGESGRGRGRARNDNAWRGGRGEQGLAPTHAAFD